MSTSIKNGPAVNATKQNGSANHNGKVRHHNEQNGSRRSRNYRPKYNDNKNSDGQRKRNNNRNAQNSLRRRGISKEVIAKVNEVRRRTENYFSDEEILVYLENHNYSTEEVVKVLNSKRDNSWASKFAKNLVIQPEQPPKVENRNKNNKKNQRNNERKNTNEAQKKKEEDIDPDAKAQVLQKTIEEKLKEIKQKELDLMNMQQELSHLGGSSQSEVLSKEKQELIEKKQRLKEEEKKIDERIKEIDSILEQVEKEKAKKISEIEQKFKSEKK